MKHRISLLLPLTTCCVGVLFCIAVFYTRNQQPLLELSTPTKPQCAHWSIFRIAQLLGVPTAPEEILRLLPNQQQGHTMAQVVETLAKIGIIAEGYRHDWDSLFLQDFPCIVHLTNPDHFVVVSGIEHERGYIHVFDDAGNRTRWRRETFEKRWTGYTLHIQKNHDFFLTKTNELKPRAVFDRLLLDKGDIPAVGEPVEFVFPIRNFGKIDLIVEDIKVNCGCLKSEKPDAPIPPGGSGAAILFYSIEPKRGVFTQTAAVKTNDPDNPVVVISACGFTGVEVRIEPSRVTLDRLFVGRESTFRCFVRYTGEWNDFEVELESTDLTGAKLIRHECLLLDKVDFSSPLLPGQPNAKISDSVAKNNRVLELTFVPTGNFSEDVSGTIVLKTNVPGYERFTLHVSGTIKSAVRVFPSIVSLDNDKEQSVTLVSPVDEPFEIVGIDCDPAIVCQYDYALRKEHQLRIRKNGVPEFTTFVVRCRLGKAQTIIKLPLTLLDYDQ